MQRLLFPCVALLLSLSGGSVHSQKADKHFEELKQKAERDYLLLAEMPKKTVEFWAAINVEIGFGKFELAGYFLKMLLEKIPAAAVDTDLVEIQQSEGYGPFLKLQRIQNWSDNANFQVECETNVKLLVKRLTAAVEAHLSAPDRINRFISRLDAPTKEERDYAYIQLVRSRDRAVPYMVETLRTQVGKPIHRKVYDVFLKVDGDFMPPLLEILKAVDLDDAKEVDLRLTILDIFRKRGDKRCVPYLWHLSNSQMYPGIIRDQAKEILAYLTATDPTKLPYAKQMLTQMAENFYQHKAKIDIGGKPFWRWDGQKIALQPDYIPRRPAEEFFGVRYAKEALDLEPAYQPAQIVMLNFILERTYDQELNTFFKKPMTPAIEKLLIGVDFELVMTVLERALNENNLAVALPLIEILGKRGDLRAAEPSLTAPTRGLPKALYYPDRRIQFAAVTALLRMPYRPIPVAEQRVVEALRRFMVAEPISKTIVVLCPEDARLKTRKTFDMAEFEKTEVRSANLEESFDRIKKSADFDVIFVHPAVTTRDLTFALTQLRGDLDCGRLPLIVLAPRDKLLLWTKLAERYPNTYVELDTFLTMPDELKKLADRCIFLASGAALTVEERVKFSVDSMVYLAKMGRRDIPGYDLRPIKDDLQGMIRLPEFAPLALETAARFPDRQTQDWLAYVALDPKYAKLKLQATTALNRHVQKHGLQLKDNDIARLKGEQAKADPELRTELALLLSNIRISPRMTGKQLQQFNPAPPK